MRKERKKLLRLGLVLVLFHQKWLVTPLVCTTGKNLFRCFVQNSWLVTNLENSHLPVNSVVTEENSLKNNSLHESKFKTSSDFS
ncbi:UNVERIFIED_CONTAM: hypothetical protein GTU68_023573 [Idotea baltica]|nr:hypothetical protein [Idotea baltica]